MLLLFDFWLIFSERIDSITLIVDLTLIEPMSPSFSQNYSLANPAGYGIAAKYQTDDNCDSNSALIQKILKDRALLERLCDRVYQMMLADLQQQQDRSRNYIGL